MAFDRERHLHKLVEFLRTIQKPGKQIEDIGVNDSLLVSGLIDSLAIIQIVLYLETSYGIDFAASGIDPERLSTMTSIIDIIDGACK